MNECPYAKTKSNISQFNINAEEIINTNNKNLDPLQNQPKKCPYNQPTEPKQEVKEDDKDSDDEKPTGGCPVMNKGTYSNKF